MISSKQAFHAWFRCDREPIAAAIRVSIENAFRQTVEEICEFSFVITDWVFGRDYYPPG